jgi:hypothetical protein
VSAAGGLECRAVALDDQLDGEGVGVVDLVKIDVEGGEADVLQGMRRGIAAARYRYVLLECHPEALKARGLSVDGCAAALTVAGYRAWMIVHTPDVHRRAAERTLPVSELLRPFSRGAAAADGWPHFFFAAPGAPDLAEE